MNIMRYMTIAAFTIFMLQNSLEKTVAGLCKYEASISMPDILKDVLPEGIEINENEKSILSVDMDKDDKKEIICVFKKNEIKNAIFLAVVKEIDGKLQVASTSKGDGDELDLLSLADMDGDGMDNILLGTRMSSSFGKLNVYDFKNNRLSKNFSKAYSKIEIVKLEGSETARKGPALAIWYKDIEKSYKIELVRWNGVELIPASELYREYFKKVVMYYEERVKESPDSAFYWYYLADAQCKTGLKKEALLSIAKGVSLNKDYPSKQQFEELKRTLK